VYARLGQSSCLQRIASPLWLGSFAWGGPPRVEGPDTLMQVEPSLSGRIRSGNAKGNGTKGGRALFRKLIHSVVLIASTRGSISFGPTSTYTGPWAMDRPPLARGVTTSSERGLVHGMRARRGGRILPPPPAFPPSHLGCAHRLVTHFLPSLFLSTPSRSPAPRSWSGL
jgi:hypothetical protein